MANKNTVSVITLAGTSVTGTYTAGCVATTLYDIAISPDGAWALLPNLSSGCTLEGIDKIAVAGLAGTWIDLNAGGGTMTGVAITADSSTAVVTSNWASAMRKVNIATGAVTTITVDTSYGVAVIPGTNDVLVVSNDVERISLDTDSSVAGIAFSATAGFHTVAVRADGAVAAVVGSFNLGIIDLGNNTVRTVSIGGTSVAVVGDIALVTNRYGETLRAVALVP